MQSITNIIVDFDEDPPEADAYIPADVLHGKSVLFDLYWLDGEVFDLSYTIGGDLYCYYPAHISSVLRDLVGELCMFSSRTSHPMSICGYPILQAEFSGNSVMFYEFDPKAAGGMSPILGNFKLEAIERSIHRAVLVVLKIAQDLSIQNPSLSCKA